jgi:hypothetical protein
MASFSVARVGGLAVALGVGAAVTTGLAATAWADSADTPSSSARVESAGERTARPAVNRGPRAASSAPQSSRNAARSIAEPRPAAALTTPARTVRASVSAPAPVALAPGASASVVSSTPVAAAVAAPRRAVLSKQATAGPVSNWLTQLLGCDPRGRHITIYKGTHFAIPNSSGLFIRETVGTGTFTTDSAYDLKDADQYDWNKFTGITFTPLEPDRNAAMVGWRYNLTTQEFEIAPYYNVDKARILPNERTEVISVPAGETFTFDVNYTGITLRYGADQFVTKPYPVGLTANVWTAARVSGWFGGNRVAPRTVSYFIRLN